MSKKIDYFEKRLVAEQIHHYIISLPNTSYDDSAKSSPIIGYKRNDQKYKFVTLHGGRSYQSLVLHVDPGNRNTTLGKEIQKEIQEILDFKISTIRSHILKSNEVYIPLEKIGSSTESIEYINTLILYAYRRQEQS
ncbi:hypothetical protein E2R56_24315 [Rhodococcus qingshengii]|nr:hypothetical protein E2R56_24315 [Rhodococcus qingshengii]